MGHDDRQGIVVFRSDMNEMDTQTVNFCSKLRIRVDASLEFTPVILVDPIINQRFRVTQGNTLSLIFDCLLVRPADVGQPDFKVLECRLGYVYLKGHEFRRRLSLWNRTGGDTACQKCCADCGCAS